MQESSVWITLGNAEHMPITAKCTLCLQEHTMALTNKGSPLVHVVHFSLMPLPELQPQPQPLGQAELHKCCWRGICASL